MYYFGSGVERDYTISVKYLKEADTHYAIYLLGNMISNGSGIKQSDDKALVLFKKSAELKDMYAQYTLGNHYKIEKNKTESIKYYKLSADQGHCDAQYELGFLYNREQEYNKASKYLRKCYNQGNERATKLLGEVLEKVCIKGAVTFYEKLPSNRALQMKIARLHIKGYYTSGKWSSRGLTYGHNAILLYEKLNDGTDGDILYYLAMLYTRTNNVSKYANYLRQSVALGNADAQCELGNYYSRSHLKNDREIAIALYKDASEQDHVLAIFMVAKLYMTRGPLFDSIKGISLLKKCLTLEYYPLDHTDTHNDPKRRARSLLAYTYNMGISVPKDIYKALYYRAINRQQYYIQEILNTDRTLEKEIIESVYYDKGLDKVDPWILTPIFKTIKKRIENNEWHNIENNTEVSKMVLLHFDLSVKKIYETKRVLDNTSLYISVLHDII
jgi:TPR repeat protein